jgi:hypothetical protein
LPAGRGPGSQAAAATGSASPYAAEWEMDHVHPNPAMGVGFFRLAVTGSQLRWVQSAAWLNPDSYAITVAVQ